MRKVLIIAFASLLIVSCGSRKHPNNGGGYKSNTSHSNLKKLTSNYSGSVSGKRASIVKNSERYLGTPYKYAGNTKSGFDCSGLVCKVFDENKMKLPRRSADQGKQGSAIKITEVKPGDLLFFATTKSSAVTHVGIVNEIARNGEIMFIHSSTSKGVIISSLNQPYWNKAFLFARSVL